MEADPSDPLLNVLATNPALLLLIPAILIPIITIALVLYLRSYGSKVDDLPPLIPGSHYLLGHMSQIDREKPHISMTALSRKHGDIYRIRVLREDVVVLNSVELVREALVTKSKEFAGRPSIFRIDFGFHYKKDIIFGTYTAKWTYMKKVAAQGLRQFGSGVGHVDKVVEQEMEALVDVFRKNTQTNFDPRLALLTAVVNGITASMIGKRYSHDDPRMEQYKTTTRLFSESCSVVEGMELDILPILRFLPNRSFSKLKRARAMLDALVDVELKEAKARYNPEEPRCILDVLLKAKEEGIEEGHPLVITDEDIRCIFVDLLVSGTFTTAIALSALLLLMIHFPRKQYRLRAESDKKIGKLRMPKAEDRVNMPYFEATMLELLRYISHVPLNLPHFTMKDTTLAGYRIPKDTKVITNLWAVHHDPLLWSEPWQFNPRRFLDINNKLIPASHERRKSLFPFGAGRRACMGENLALERMFLYATCLIQRFQFLPPDGYHQSCDPRDFQLGLILEPKEFFIRIYTRKRLTDQTSLNYEIDTDSGSNVSDVE